MGMTEYEKRMVELEKKKVKILTGIYHELMYMNKSRPRDDRDCVAITWSEEGTGSEIPESI